VLPQLFRFTTNVCEN